MALMATEGQAVAAPPDAGDDDPGRAPRATPATSSDAADAPPADPWLEPPPPERPAAQAQPPERMFWINLGIGPARIDRGGLTTGGSVSAMLARMPFLVSARYTYTEDFRFCLFGCSDIPATENDLALLFGVAHHGDKSLLSLAVGPGWAYGNPRAASVQRFSKPALAAGSQLFLRGRRAGLGLEGFVNVNGGITVAGVLACLQLGWF